MVPAIAALDEEKLWKQTGAYRAAAAMPALRAGRAARDSIMAKN